MKVVYHVNDGGGSGCGGFLYTAIALLMFGIALLDGNGVILSIIIGSFWPIALLLSLF